MASKIGRKAGPGRPKGSRNKVSIELQGLAQEHTPAGIRELARLALKSKNDMARIAAIKELLDRGHGKAPQPLQHSGGLTMTHEQRLEYLKDKLVAAGIEPEAAPDAQTPEDP